MTSPERVVDLMVVRKSNLSTRLRPSAGSFIAGCIECGSPVVVCGLVKNTAAADNKIGYRLVCDVCRPTPLPALPPHDTNSEDER